ncbi:MAG: hypothetical protein JO167_02495 [Alphaproteobacteria bacterium]|nr:hypothetical protein [Alphaproteobacteria bacterium]MBV9905755.1 hypothetical protein [Alphaproteobacteria bacterium]
MDRPQAAELELGVRRFAFIAAALAVASVAAQAGTAPPKELAAMRATLAKAVGARDWKAITALTAWPLKVEMYEAPPTVTLAEFNKKRGTLMGLFGNGDKDLLKCVATAPVTQETDKTRFGFGDWVADCNGNEFHFAQRAGKWLFVTYENINE